MDAQADLSLRWAHTHFVDFVVSRFNLFLPKPKNFGPSFFFPFDNNTKRMKRQYQYNVPFQSQVWRLLRSLPLSLSSAVGKKVVVPLIASICLLFFAISAVLSMFSISLFVFCFYRAVYNNNNFFT